MADLKITKDGIRQAVLRAARADSTWVELVERVSTQIANYHIAEYRSETIKKLQEQKSELEKRALTLQQDFNDARKEGHVLKAERDAARRELEECRGELEANTSAVAEKVATAAIEAVRAQHEPAPGPVTLTRQNVALALLNALDALDSFRPLRIAWINIRDQVAGDSERTLGNRFVHYLTNELVGTGGARFHVEDSETELEEAKEHYYQAGGVPSDVGARDAHWYWRRAAKLWRDRATSKLIEIDSPAEMEDVLESLNEVAGSGCLDGRQFARAWHNMSTPTQKFVATRIARYMANKRRSTP